MSATAGLTGASGSGSIRALLGAMSRHVPQGPVRGALERLGGVKSQVGDVDGFGMAPLFIEESRRLLDFLTDRYFGLRVEGIENIPDDGAGILVANHAGLLPWDALVLSHAVRERHHARRDLRPLIDDVFFYFPYLGTLATRLGAVRAARDNAVRLLNEGALVAAFPEGLQGMGKPFKERYKIQRFGRGGVVRLAIDTGAPIIPVAIIGSEEAARVLLRVHSLGRALPLPFLPMTPTFPLLGPLGLLPLPSRWHIRIGEPMDIDQAAAEESAHVPEEQSDLPVSERVKVKRVNRWLRGTIQSMLDEMLAQRERLAR